MNEIVAYNRKLFDRVRALDLPAGQYAIVGSGPLGARGLRKVTDVDIMVSDALWQDLRKKHPVIASDVPKILLADDVECFSAESFPPKQGWPTSEEQLAQAEEIDGLYFQCIDHALFFKSRSGRVKDRYDATLLEGYLVGRDAVEQQGHIARRVSVRGPVIDGSKALVAEGEQLLKQLDAISVLSQFGTVTVDGSLSYGLMVNPDIDMCVWMAPPTLEAAAKAAQYFASRADVRRTFVSNHLNFKSRLAHQPTGVYLGLNVPVGERMWNFDIWFLKPGAEAVMADMPDAWYKKLSEQQKEQILQLKYDLIQAGDYGKTVFSADVYRGVVLGKVRTVQELQSWLKKPS